MSSLSNAAFSSAAAAAAAAAGAAAAASAATPSSPSSSSSSGGAMEVARLDLAAAYAPRSLSCWACPMPVAAANAGSMTTASPSGGQNPFDSATTTTTLPHQQQRGGSFVVTQQQAAATATSPSILGTIFGTERGSLHFRAFVVPSKNSNSSVNNPNSNNANSSSTVGGRLGSFFGSSGSNPSASSQFFATSASGLYSSGVGGGSATVSNPLLSPLGMNNNTTSSSSSSNTATLSPPRAVGGASARSAAAGSALIGGWGPVDLPPGSLAGSVVSCLRLGGSRSHLMPSINPTSSWRQYGAGVQQPLQQPQQQQWAFLLLLDDNRGAASSSTSPQPGAYQTALIQLTLPGPSSSAGSTSIAVAVGSFQLLATSSGGGSSSHNPSAVAGLPRMSCAVYHPRAGLVYGAGRSVSILGPDGWWWDEGGITTTLPGSTHITRGGSSNTPTSSGRYPRSSANATTSSSGAASTSMHAIAKRLTSQFPLHALPSPGIRSGQDALAVVAQGRVAVVAVGNTFYAVASTVGSTMPDAAGGTTAAAVADVLKILTFTQSSQVHPVLVLEVPDPSMDADWSCLFVASGRECAVIDLHVLPLASGANAAPTTTTGGRSTMSVSKPRHGTASVTVASPILAAATSIWPWLALLTSDGLVSIRSPSCLAIPLRTVEVGQRPNDYFALRDFTASMSAFPTTSSWPGTVWHESSNNSTFSADIPFIVAAAYSGQGKILQCQPDSAQDLADRLMRHAIDAFGSNGFPRAELAEAVHASFSATSYVGPEPTLHARTLLKQYLEAVLGLTDFESGARSSWPTEWTPAEYYRPYYHPSPLEQQSAHHGMLRSGAGGDFGLSSNRFFDAAAGSTTTPANQRKIPRAVVSAESPAALLTCTALLCLVCVQLSPPHSRLAARAAKACAQTMGVVFWNGDTESDHPDHSKPSNAAKATVQVCALVADRILREASSNLTLLSAASPSPIVASRMHRGSSSQSNLYTEFVESAIWMFRAVGLHARAMEVAYDRLQQPASQSEAGTTNTGRGFWSQIKYESYTATHLIELWNSGKSEACQLVLQSPAMYRLLENNPRLGLGVFTAMHPQNELQWQNLMPQQDPLADPSHVYKVVELLKSIQPAVPYDREPIVVNSNLSNVKSLSNDSDPQLPLDSGRAIAVTFLESAIGISTGRSTVPDPADAAFDALPLDESLEEHRANFHDELSFLLLEGVISERRDHPHVGAEGGIAAAMADDENDSALGQIYRCKLRRLLQWSGAKLRPDQFMNALPSTFLQEKALVLGLIGRHEDALRILYRDLDSLDLALQYCDARHERQKLEQEKLRSMRQVPQALQQQPSTFFPDITDGAVDEDNAYLPLVRVALDSEDKDRGTAAAIQVLALRRGAINRAAALRMLPADVPVSAVARPFLIPAVVDSESQVRRLTVVAALLRARYVRLKDELTTAQLKAQSHLTVVPQFQHLNFGAEHPLHSTKAFKARTNATASMTMPDVMIVKHFFPRHLVIQAKVTNTNTGGVGGSISDAFGSSKFGGSGSGNASGGRTLTDIAFVVAESSEEAIQPLMQVPIQVLPPRRSGSAWCVLTAAPGRMEGAVALLTCELRYTVQNSTHQDVAAMFPTSSSSGSVASITANSSLMGRTYVEELQDLEVHAAHFS